MKVKKILGSWFPSENKDLKVGETIEITDPKQLILDGVVVAIDESGEEQTAYELFGTLTPADKAEFEAFQDLKKAKKQEVKLQKENEELKELADLPVPTSEDLKAKRLAAMAAGREKAKAAREAGVEGK